LEKTCIIWCDYAAAFQAVLESVNTKQLQDFAFKYISKDLSFFTGEGYPPQRFDNTLETNSTLNTQPGSACDD